MKNFAIFLLICLFTQNLWATSALEEIYGYGSGAMEKCTEAYVKRKMEELKNEPVIDVGALKEDAEAYCKALAQREVDATIDEQHWSDLITTMELLSKNSLTAQEILDFYSQPELKLIVAGGLAATTLAASNTLARIPLIGTSLRFIAPTVAVAVVVGSPGQAQAYQVQVPNSIDTNDLMLRTSDSTEDSALIQFSLNFTSEEQLFLIETYKAIRSYEHQKLLEECKRTNPHCQFI